jgi:hypothetical protein
MTRLRQTTVFVVGAGFSYDLGYPLTRDLLHALKMSKSLKSAFEEVVHFHHPTWDGRTATLPDIEELLTEWAANEELLPSLRTHGRFNVEDLRQLRTDLLSEIASWFHRIHGDNSESRNRLLKRFKERLERAKNPIIISFNWDYELDKFLFGDDINPSNYGLDETRFKPPVLLKPHGSLNRYPAETGKHIKEELRKTLWHDKDSPEETMYCFLRWRTPKSSHNRQYVPWIVPPTHVKEVGHDMLKMIWRRCVDCLSVANEVFFIGYSLPVADRHSRYIFRWGFHNQKEGQPSDDDEGRAPASGPAKVYVVDPDNSAFRRIESIAGEKCAWIASTAKRWLREGK